MDKISDSEDETLTLHNVESFVLDKILTQHGSAGGDSSINIGELIESVNSTMLPLFDQAIEDLIAQSLIHSEDGEHYQITPDGIEEVKSRKGEAIPL